MSGKIYLNSSTKFIPQKDFAVQQTENGGIEATQTYLCRYTSLGTADLTPFRRGTRADALWPDVPSIYRGLRVKTAIPNHHEGSGMWEIKVVFTGTLFAFSTSPGSSGAEQTVPTYSLSGNLEEAPLNEHPKWANLDDEPKLLLGFLLSGSASSNENFTLVGDYVEKEGGGSEFGQRKKENGDNFSPLSGDALVFAKMVAQGKTTFKKPSYTWTVREESEYGFTSEQLSKLGEVVNPPGNPPSPGSAWKWMLTGPSQEQSGEGRFFKDSTYLLVANNEENNFLYN